VPDDCDWQRRPTPVHEAVSVTTRHEGSAIRLIAGRGASEGKVVGRGLANCLVDGGTVAGELAPEPGDGAEHTSSLAEELGALGSRERVDGGVFDAEGLAEGDEAGVGEVDQQKLGGED